MGNNVTATQKSDSRVDHDYYVNGVDAGRLVFRFDAIAHIWPQSQCIAPKRTHTQGDVNTSGLPSVHTLIPNMIYGNRSSLPIEVWMKLTKIDGIFSIKKEAFERITETAAAVARINLSMLDTDTCLERMVSHNSYGDLISGL